MPSKSLAESCAEPAVGQPTLCSINNYTESNLSDLYRNNAMLEELCARLEGTPISGEGCSSDRDEGLVPNLHLVASRTSSALAENARLIQRLANLAGIEF